MYLYITMSAIYESYLHAQNNFSYQVCESIFPGDTDHYWKKWVYAERNILLFISRLDKMNRLKVLDWIGMDWV